MGLERNITGHIIDMKPVRGGLFRRVRGYKMTFIPLSGGRAEEKIHFIFNRRLDKATRARLRDNVAMYRSRTRKSLFRRSMYQELVTGNAITYEDGNFVVKSHSGVHVFDFAERRGRRWKDYERFEEEPINYEGDT